MLSKIKTEGSSFFQAVSASNETVYLILLTLYVAIYFELKIAFTGEVANFIEKARYAVLGIVMWGSAVYLFFIIAAWKDLWRQNFWLVFVGAVLLASVGYFSTKMSTNAYGVVFDIVFCVLAAGKSFRKMLKCILGVVIFGLIIAGMGIRFGYTVDLGKPETATPGHSLGINYPNTWGYLVFLGLIILWYLYLRYKPVLTFIIFWAVCAFMYKYILCRTISGITLVFPFLAFFVDWIEKKMDKKVESGTFKRKRPLEWLLISIPFLSFAFMMANSMAVNWWHQYYYGKLRNLAWRFIQGGLYFKTYGLPIFGNPYRSNVYTYVNVEGDFIKVGILDSSFAAYIIMRGMVWLFYTLLWLCIAHWKALKKRDYAIIFLETILLGFAMMERPGLEMWYNFILLYPLAKVFSKPRAEKFLEFDEEEESSDLKIIEFEKEYKAFMEVKELPLYRTEEADEAYVSFDEEKGVYILNLPEDMDKEGLYDIFSQVLYTERFVKGDEEKKQVASGFIRYSVALTQLSYQMGFKTISESKSVSMKDMTRTGLSLNDYVIGKYDAALNAFVADDLTEDALLSLYDFLGTRSFCEMFATDFDRSKYDMAIFSEKLGSSIFNKIDNHMHGKPEEFLFNMNIQDYKEALEVLSEQ